MKVIFTNKTIPFFFPCFLILLLIGCEQETIAETNEDANLVYETFSIKAEDILYAFENKDPDMIGVFVRIHAHGVQLDEVLLVDDLFQTNGVKHYPNSTLKRIDKDGNEVSQDLIKEHEMMLIPINASQDLVYFNWSQIQMIAKNSETIQFSNSSLQYGLSIHEPGLESQIFPTLKMEGDFKKYNPSKTDQTPTAMFAIGAPCPPVWIKGQ